MADVANFVRIWTEAMRNVFSKYNLGKTDIKDPCSNSLNSALVNEAINFMPIDEVV